MSENSIPTQTCWGCKHLFVEFEPDWSDVTPGAGFELRCLRSHFWLGQRMTKTEFATAMQQGFSCPDYESD